MKVARRYLLNGACVIGLLCSAGGLAAAKQATPGETTSSAQPKDIKLEKKIDARLQKDPQLKNRAVDAMVSDGTVTLGGVVYSAAEKAQAEQLAQIKGVTGVDNQIEVQKPAQPAAGESGSPSPAPASTSPAPVQPPASPEPPPAPRPSTPEK